MTGSIKRSSPYILGVAGGSGSGKTYFAQALAARLGDAHCSIISQDNFYIDQSKRFDFDGGSVNFDHPSSIDFERLASTLRQLKAGSRSEIPVYDFKTHSRLARTIAVEPKALIIVDGILIFHSEPVRLEFHDTFFFDTKEDLRFQRRLDRDVKERGRTPEGVHAQFFKQVKPMHDEFVEPSKHHARKIITEDTDFSSFLDEACRLLA
ncbi:MAG: uridine kinase [Bdellovibrionota bacterium]